MSARKGWLLLTLCGLTGCIDDVTARSEFCRLRPDICADAGSPDAGPPPDAGTMDAGRVDAGPTDAGPTDAGEVDAGPADAGELDAGVPDAGPIDAGIPDAGPPDAGTCGDGISNVGELCDDGNSASGDTCDPSCQFTNRLEWISGYPGTQSYADSEVPLSARFYSVSSMSGDRTRFFVADRYMGAVREVALPSGVVTTVMGGPRGLGGIDGGLVGPIDLAYHLLADGGLGAMYVLDGEYNPDGGTVYRVDFSEDPPAVRVFWSFPAGGVYSVVPGYLGWSERLAVLTDYGIQYARVFANGGFGSDAPLAQRAELNNFSVGNASCFDVEYGGVDTDGGTGSTYYVGCPSSLVRITTGGTKTVIGGVAGSAGCADGPSGTARVGDPVRISWGGDGGLLFADRACDRIRRLNVATGAIVTISGADAGSGAGDSDGPNTTAVFSSPTAVVTTGGAVVASDITRVRSISATRTTTLAGAPPRPAQVFGVDAGYIGAGGVTSDGTNAWAIVPFQQQLFQVALDGGIAREIGFLTNVGGGNFPGPIVRVGSTLYVGYVNGAVRQVALSGLPTDGGVAAAGTIDAPFVSVTGGVTALATDGTSVFALTGDRRVVMLGVPIRVIAGSSATSTPIDGLGTAARFESPRSLAYANGNLYTLDGPAMTGATMLREIALDGGMVTTLAGVRTERTRVDGIGAFPGDAGVARLVGANGLAASPRFILIGDVGKGAYQQEGEGPTLRLFDLQTHRLGTAAGRVGQYSYLTGTGRFTMVNNPTHLTWDSVAQRFVLFDNGEYVFSTFR